LNSFSTRLTHLLPALKPIGSTYLKEGEVLITASGFEKRALAAAETLKCRNSGHAVVLEYRPHDERNRAREIASILGRNGFSSIVFCEYDRFDPEKFPESIKTYLRQLTAEKILLDISAMSKLAIILCLDVCKELNCELRVFYAEASTYGPSYAAFEEAKAQRDLHQPSMQVYNGIKGVLRVARLSSVSMQGQPTAAIAFMSLNDFLTQALLDVAYPSRLFLINGRPPKHTWREEATAWIHELLRQEWPEEDNPLITSGPRKGLPQRTTSTLDYRETVLVLLDLYWKLAVDHRVLLAPTGSKLQAVGCFFAKALHPDIHIEYPTPNGFLDLYSDGIGKKWIGTFGKLGDKIDALRFVERKAHLSVG
jgi:hypothetical protein